MTPAEIEIKRRADAASAHNQKMYANEVLEQTDTLKMTAFTHGQGTRYTIYDRVEGGQWRMLLQGNDEKIAAGYFADLKAGLPPRRLN